MQSLCNMLLLVWKLRCVVLRVFIYMLIKTEYTVISKFKKVSTTVFLNFTTLHVYNSYLQAELFIATIFYYYIKKLLMSE